MIDSYLVFFVFPYPLEKTFAVNLPYLSPKKNQSDMYGFKKRFPFERSKYLNGNLQLDMIYVFTLFQSYSI